MTLIAVILAVSLVLVVAAFLQHIQRLEAAWTVERRELCTRIQAPERIPIGDQPQFVVPDVEDDELAQVGTINFDFEEG